MTQQRTQKGNAARKRWRLGREKRWNKFSDPLFADKETNPDWVKRKQTKDIPLSDEGDTSMYDFSEHTLEQLEELEIAYETIYGIMGDRDDELMFELKSAIDEKIEQLEPTVDEIKQTTTEEIEDEDDWIDPAGGHHSANEADPAKMYE